MVKIYRTKRGDRVHLNFIMNLKLYEKIENLCKDYFRSYGEFLRFCVVNTLIHMKDSEFLRKIEKSDLKRYIPLRENEVEMDGVLYCVKNGFIPNVKIHRNQKTLLECVKN